MKIREGWARVEENEGAGTCLLRSSSSVDGGLGEVGWAAGRRPGLSPQPQRRRRTLHPQVPLPLPLPCPCPCPPVTLTIGPHHFVITTEECFL